LDVSFLLSIAACSKAALILAFVVVVVDKVGWRLKLDPKMGLSGV
jgi:hypothetical protein